MTQNAQDSGVPSQSSKTLCAVVFMLNLSYCLVSLRNVVALTVLTHRIHKESASFALGKEIPDLRPEDCGLLCSWSPLPMLGQGIVFAFTAASGSTRYQPQGRVG